MSSLCAQWASGEGDCASCSLSCHEGSIAPQPLLLPLDSRQAGCHQVDKVSHFARRQDYSQGQRLKWLLFELQSPEHSHTARRRERHMRTSPFTMPIPFRIHCLHRDHSIAAAEHTRRQQAPCERQNTRRYSRFSLLYTKLLFEEMCCQLCYDTARAKYKIYLIFFFFSFTSRFAFVLVLIGVS